MTFFYRGYLDKKTFANYQSERDRDRRFTDRYRYNGIIENDGERCLSEISL